MACDAAAKWSKIGHWLTQLRRTRRPADAASAGIRRTNPPSSCRWSAVRRTRA
jgi:hypothetical protein